MRFRSFGEFGNNIESGFFCCPKCLFDVIYDEKSHVFCGAKKPNDGNRNLFINHFVYDYDGGDYDINLDKMSNYHNSGIQNWFVPRTYCDEEYYEKFIKEREQKIKSGNYATPKLPKPDDLPSSNTSITYGDWAYYANNVVHSEIEKRFICFKCSYKGTIWDFIDKEKENIIKTRRNILKMERDKNELEKEKQKLQHEIEELKFKKKENESNNADNTKIKNEKKNNFKLTFENKEKNINFSVECNENDKFKELEDKFIEKFPNYSDYELSFSVNGKNIKRHKTLKDNKIQNNNIINVNIED